MSTGARVFDLLLNSVVFHYARLPAYWGTMPRLARALDVQPGEWILDVGCGTGIGTALARGSYVGIDMDQQYLRFAHRWVARPGCAFFRMSATDLAFRDGAFDKAVLINMVHHLDGGTLDRFLVELTRVVRKSVVVLDAAPDTANALSRFFFAHDRGDYIRPRRDLRALLERRYRVEHEEVFHNAMRSISQVLFTLGPKPESVSPRAGGQRLSQPAPPG